MIRQYVKDRVTKAVEAGELSGLEGMLALQSGNLGVQSADLDESLFLSIKKGDVNVTECLLTKGKANIRCTGTTRDFTPLHYACQLGDLDMVKLLLSSGAPYTLTDKLQNTGLHYASDHGHSHVVMHLLKSGARNDSSKNKYQETPLHVACKMGRVDIAQRLIAAGGSVNMMTSRNETPLHLAVQSGKTSLVTLLLECGARPNKLDSKGRSALCIAVEFQLVETVQILLQNGADPSISDSGSLYIAATIFHKEQCEDHITKMANLLLEYGADPNKRVGESGYTALHGAAQTGNVAMARILLDKVDNTDCRGYKASSSTPLALAVTHGHPQVAQLLLEHGANPRYRNCQQLGLLHNIEQISKASDRREMLELLLVAGVPVNPISLSGQTPIGRCLMKVLCTPGDLRDVIARLTQAGACLRLNECPHHFPHADKMEDAKSEIERKSILCHLTLRRKLNYARFLVTCGMDFKKDKWIYLPVASTPEVDEFVRWLRDLHQNPRRLDFMCRNVTRHHVSVTSGDTDIKALIARLPIPNKIQSFLNLEGEAVELMS